MRGEHAGIVKNIFRSRFGLQISPQKSILCVKTVFFVAESPLWLSKLNLSTFESENIEEPRFLTGRVNL